MFLYFVNIQHFLCIPLNKRLAMAFNCIFNSALLLPTFAILTAATGFLDQGCTTSELPWYLDDGVAKAYCATHICDSNVQTTLNLNLCVGNVEGQLVAAKEYAIIHSNPFT